MISGKISTRIMKDGNGRYGLRWKVVGDATALRQLHWYSVPCTCRFYRYTSATSSTFIVIQDFSRTDVIICDMRANCSFIKNRYLCVKEIPISICYIYLIRNDACNNVFFYGFFLRPLKSVKYSVKMDSYESLLLKTLVLLVKKKLSSLLENLKK